MVRMSKQKQEKLEAIMSLVEQLGIDRVLGRLRQTKMMSKEVLDDMKEWETDYEKRVALLGFLVSPEGKRAFGALFELAKVHQEQVKLQEEQEKLRQEQLAQQPPPVEVKRPAAGGHGSLAHGSKSSTDRPNAGASMKNKLRAQLLKKRTSNASSNPPQESQTSNSNGKSTKSKKKAEDKDDPLLQEAARTLEEAVRLEKEKKRIDAYRNQLAASEGLEKPAPNSSRRSGNSPRRTPTPVTMAENSDGAAEAATKPTKATKTDGQAKQHEEKEMTAPKRARKLSENATSAAPNAAEKHVNFKSDPVETPKALNDFKRHKSDSDQGEASEKEDGHWAKTMDEQEDPEPDEEESDEPEIERLPPEGENLSDIGKSKDGRDSAEVKSDAANAPDGKSKPKTQTKVESQDETNSKFSPQNKLMSTLGPLLDTEIDLNEVRGLLLADIVDEWRMLRKEREEVFVSMQNQAKVVKQLKGDLKSVHDEKDIIQKEKDRYVFKEFELQQKLQDLTQKHRTLREDHEALKQGNHQIQQNTKKASKLHQDMKKKIAKLESKIKSMDKVTIRRGTQTDDQLDKNVHDALRMAEESLSVNQNELSSVQGKLKNALQEIDDLKKQVNLKGREINKRERKGKKDEENIRMVSRERDAMETKLRKVSEQMEYYKTMMEMKTKGSKRPPQEKKEVKVQRCASGRHVMIKSVPVGVSAATCAENSSETGHNGALKSPGSRTPRTTSSKTTPQNGGRTKQSEPAEKGPGTPRKSNAQAAPGAASGAEVNQKPNKEAQMDGNKKSAVKTKPSNASGSKSEAGTPRSNVSTTVAGTSEKTTAADSQTEGKVRQPLTPRKNPGSDAKLASNPSDAKSGASTGNQESSAAAKKVKK